MIEILHEIGDDVAPHVMEQWAAASSSMLAALAASVPCSGLSVSDVHDQHFGSSKAGNGFDGGPSEVEALRGQRARLAAELQVLDSRISECAWAGGAAASVGTDADRALWPWR